jgi:branched-chain amino acid transport system ATP-binding protein
LEVESLSVAYGGLHALVDVSITVGDNDFVGLVGPNGAGKTTLVKTIAGTVRPISGRIRYEGADLLKIPASQRPHLGIAHVPEGRLVFPSLTVAENLEMGAGTKAGQARWADNLAFILELFPLLRSRSRQLAGTLSGGEQQMVAIGRGLASAPRLLMLDEPSQGLAPSVADAIFDAIEKVHREAGVAILLVEQRVLEALESCVHGYVLNTGRVVVGGDRDALVSSEWVGRAYLGGHNVPTRD